MKFSDLTIGMTFTTPGGIYTYRKVGDDEYVGVGTSAHAFGVAGTMTVIGSRNRFDDAVEIQAGAVNVQAIANALVRACKENRDEPGRTTFEDDSAIRLMVHQLAWLCFHKDPATHEQWTFMTKEAREKSLLAHNKE